MRIALFSGNYNYLREGANQALNRLVAYLEAKAGCQVRVYSPVTDRPAFEPAGTLVPVPSIALPVRSEFRLALGLPSAIRADVRSFDPDIVHVSTPDILNMRAQTLAKQMGVPIVISMHTQFESYLDYYGIGWLRPLVEAHLRRFYRRGNHVVAPTPALVDAVCRMRGDESASVWSRGVDRLMFNPSRRDADWRLRMGLADEEIAVLFFGRLVLEKGIGTFVEVVRELRRRGARVRALVVGDGPASGLFHDLPGAILTGHLEGTALARAIASADVMLTPSTTETFGNVVLEAMASGVPVVSADAPSARALLVEGVTGLLCPPRDIAQYADHIMQLVDRHELRAQVGSAARQASHAFSWDASCESVVRAYGLARGSAH
ncbi:glycosyltransferase family 4 protein [Rhizorhabdus argentea]|uniref:glycosyltransferase family 4 protein n=1 Tax=Rhizorhabdus argentea TaxID=1387174 RepID=UPI0030EF5F06